MNEEITTGTWARLWVGYCPECGRLLAYLNDGASWPPATCQCGWLGGLPEMNDRTLFDPMERRGWLQSGRPDREGVVDNVIRILTAKPGDRQAAEEVKQHLLNYMAGEG